MMHGAYGSIGLTLWSDELIPSLQKMTGHNTLGKERIDKPRNSDCRPCYQKADQGMLKISLQEEIETAKKQTPKETVVALDHVVCCFILKYHPCASVWITLRETYLNTYHIMHQAISEVTCGLWAISFRGRLLGWLYPTIRLRKGQCYATILV